MLAVGEVGGYNAPRTLKSYEKLCNHHCPIRHVGNGMPAREGEQHDERGKRTAGRDGTSGSADRGS